MPMGSRHDEIGLLRWDRGTLILLRDEGGRWRLETGRRAETMVGRRVHIVGLVVIPNGLKKNLIAQRRCHGPNINPRRFCRWIE